MNKTPIKFRVQCLLQQEEGSSFPEPPNEFSSDLTDRSSIESTYSCRLNILLKLNPERVASISRFRNFLEKLGRIKDDKIRFTSFVSNGLYYAAFTDVEATQLLFHIVLENKVDHLGFHQP